MASRDVLESRGTEVRKINGMKVGFIGMTLEGTPGIVAPAGITHLKFLDEADTANQYARVLRHKGVKAIVVLLHQGGFQSVPFNTSTINTCTGFSGDVTDIIWCGKIAAPDRCKCFRTQK